MALLTGAVVNAGPAYENRRDMALTDDSPIQYVRGVGPRRAEAFATLGLRTIGDLLSYYPFRYEWHQGDVQIADVEPGKAATIRGEVVDVDWRGSHVRAEIDDGTQPCLLSWFRPQTVPRGLSRGVTVVATGRAQMYDGMLSIVQPRVQVFPPDAVLMQPRRRRRMIGVYRGNQRIKSPTIARAVDAVLAERHLPVSECLPAELRAKRKLMPREQAVRAMHQPKSEDQLAEARRRLAYEEFFLLELALALRRNRLAALREGWRFRVTPTIDRHIRARFPFKLTEHQDQAIREITRDLESGRSMTRLLQGDVGSGKTVVALYACLAAIAHRCQAAIMAPTEVLAQQHYSNIERYLAGSRVRRVLLRGRLGKRTRADTLAAIAAGEIDLVVGTQALLQQDVAFSRLGLVVVDEQHKFGVAQRANLRSKGPLPHALVMTATPIPRSLVMTVLGDLDVSLIRGSPPGRGRITTRVVTPGKWPAVMKYVRQRLEAGEQAYVVCPAIGALDADGMAGESPARAGRETDQNKSAARGTRRSSGAAGSMISAREAYEKLTSGPWRGLAVGLLHGGMKSDEKRATIEAFAAGALKALVSTTVVEVGVDVAAATIMVVENADRFGLSQLHQLRGRVGRGSRDSLCVLIARSRGQKARERLEVLAETTDGFKIAETDLRLRGPGQLLGTRQHGLPELRVGDMVADFGLLSEARDDAFALAASDPQLNQADHPRLVEAIRRLWGEKLVYVDAG